MLGQLLFYVSILVILHAAYSTYEHQSHMKALGKSEQPLPRDIVLECLLGLMGGILGASLRIPPLKEITWISEMQKRSIDEMDARPGFATYINRGRNIFSQHNAIGKN